MNTEETTITTIGEVVRKAESDYVQGTTQISKYVQHSMYEVIETIYAYLNSTHISGKFDDQGREKPFFNIVIAAANIWMRATDIDRRNITVRATKQQDWIDAFLATVKLQEWMKKEKFGKFLNKWGRILSRYGSAIIKVVENSKGLHIKAMQWSRMIVDSVDFAANPKIEIIEITEAELWQRVQTHGYSATEVASLCYALQERELADKRKKDTKPGFIRLYEVHGVFQKSLVTYNESDRNVFAQQMHVVSFVAKKNGRKTEYEDFTLYSGLEKKDPYRLTHLIEEDDRTLSIGAVEYLFESQWMQNDSVKSIKDQLELASKLIYQTTDPKFVGGNVLTDIEQGSIFVVGEGHSFSRIDNGSQDIVSQQNFAVQWKNLGNEMVGISEAMLGAQPKSGTAWRQVEALLEENYSLFEYMTENKGLHLEDLLREDIIPWIKKGLDTSDEVAAVLQQHDIDRIDALYLKNFSLKHVKRQIKRQVIDGEPITPEQQEVMIAETQEELREALKKLGDQRFFKPSNIDDRTWKDQFENLEWELEIDITGEQRNVQQMLTTLNTALQLVVQPGFDQNPKAKAIVGQILELTGAMSPVQFNALPSAEVQQVEPQDPAAAAVPKKPQLQNVA